MGNFRGYAEYEAGCARFKGKPIDASSIEKREKISKVIMIIPKHHNFNTACPLQWLSTMTGNPQALSFSKKVEGSTSCVMISLLTSEHIVFDFVPCAAFESNNAINAVCEVNLEFSCFKTPKTLFIVSS